MEKQTFLTQDYERRQIERLFNDMPEMTLEDLQSRYDRQTVQDIIYCPTISIVKKKDKPITFNFDYRDQCPDWWDVVADIAKFEGRHVSVMVGVDKVRVGPGPKDYVEQEHYDQVKIEEIPELEQYIKGV